MTTLHFLPKDDILFSVCERRKFVIRDAMTFTGNLLKAKTIKPKERIALTVSSSGCFEVREPTGAYRHLMYCMYGSIYTTLTY